MTLDARALVAALGGVAALPAGGKAPVSARVLETWVAQPSRASVSTPVASAG